MSNQLCCRHITLEELGNFFSSDFAKVEPLFAALHTNIGALNTVLLDTASQYEELDSQQRFRMRFFLRVRAA